ncbi:MAG: ClbS/DfsB family four-helix bundle protein [Ornithinimicrobium sp.]
MAASTKTELLSVSRKEFDKLSELLDHVETESALAKDRDDTSIKDVVGHRAHWITLYLGWYTDGLAGRDVFFPAQGYTWNELKRYNADLRQRQANLGWEEARSSLRHAYSELIEFIVAMSEADLYGGPMKGAKNAWTPGRWAEAAGPSHFRSASKYVRARLRNG